jgi:hypothetical protein
MISKEEWHELKKKEKLLKKSCEILRVEDKFLVRTIERFQKDLEKKS